MTFSLFESRKALWYAQKAFVEHWLLTPSKHDPTPLGVIRKKTWSRPPCQPLAVSTAWSSFSSCWSVRQYGSLSPLFASLHPFAGSGLWSTYEPPNVDWYWTAPEPSVYCVATE